MLWKKSINLYRCWKVTPKLYFVCGSRYRGRKYQYSWYRQFADCCLLWVIIYLEVSGQSASPRRIVVDNLLPSFKGSKRDTWIYPGRCKVWSMSHKMTGSASKTSHTWYILINTDLKYSTARFWKMRDAYQIPSTI